MSGYDLQTLSDRAEISEVFNRYAIAVDTRNWSLFRSLFTEDAEADFSSMHPDVVYSGTAWTDYAERTMAGLHATHHIITNHSHDIQGDTAKCTAYLHGQHIAKNEAGDLVSCILGGYYSYDMVRTSEGWKIKRYRLTVTWTAGSTEDFARALALG